MDRSILPEVHDVYMAEEMHVEQRTLGNGIEVHYIRNDHRDTVTLKLQFGGSGKWGVENPVIAEAAACIMTSGNAKYDHDEMHDRLDYIAANMNAASGAKYGNVEMTCLRHYLAEALELLSCTLKQPTYPEKDVKNFKDDKILSLKMTEQNVEAKASNALGMAIYGDGNPYYTQGTTEQVEAMTREDIMDFHTKHYSSDSCVIFMTGRIDDEVLEMVDKHLGGNDWSKGGDREVGNIKVTTTRKNRKTEVRDEVVQNAVYMGHPDIYVDGEDFCRLKMMNTILGGMFSSRLQTSIREEKGYTYGIYSYLSMRKEMGHIEIASQVGIENTDALITEMFHQMKRLREEYISDDELSMIKREMTSRMLADMDSPSKQLSLYMLMYTGLRPKNYVKRMKSVISTTTKADIRETAEKYLKEEDFIISVAGRCKDLKTV